MRSASGGWSRVVLVLLDVAGCSVMHWANLGHCHGRYRKISAGFSCFLLELGALTSHI